MTDIEKLARDVVQCADDGLHPEAAFLEDLARAYVAEKQRADALLDANTALRECLRSLRGAAGVGGDALVNACRKADGLLRETK